MAKRTAVVAITKHGTGIARRLLEHMGDAVDIYYPSKFAQGDEEQRGIQLFADSVVAHVPQLFGSYQGLVGIFSLGAMVRMIAPHLKDKKTDPAVVVIDDRAQYVISVLSGHLGGANELTVQVALALGAKPVITTASDVRQTLPVDLLGSQFGWVIENFEQVTTVSAAVINEESIALIQEAGERNWWSYNKPLPAYVHVFESVDRALASVYDAALIVTPRILSASEHQVLLRRGVLYRPKVLVLGIGCNRGTEDAEIEQVILSVLHSAKLSILSVRAVATIDLKAAEAGLLSICANYQWSLITYTAEELRQVAITHPSEAVFHFVGTYGVAEPAAKLCAGADRWIVEKVKSGNVTVSVCQIPDSSLQDLNFPLHSR